MPITDYKNNLRKYVSPADAKYYVSAGKEACVSIIIRDIHQETCS